MSKSFFLGTDAEVYTASALFSAKISAAPSEYGLSVPLASAYSALNEAYAAAYRAAVDPQTRTMGAVAAKNDSKRALKAMASSLAKIIAGTLTVTSEQKIDLGLSVRAAPTPVNTLGKPGKFTVTLDETGALALQWKCAHPRASGTVYQIWRRIGAQGEFVFLGSVGRKRFTDGTLPAGTPAITYQIQAVRSTAAGPRAQFNVNFGTNGGTLLASVVETAPLPTPSTTPPTVPTPPTPAARLAA